MSQKEPGSLKAIRNKMRPQRSISASEWVIVYSMTKHETISFGETEGQVANETNEPKLHFLILWSTLTILEIISTLNDPNNVGINSLRYRG